MNVIARTPIVAVAVAALLLASLLSGQAAAGSPGPIARLIERDGEPSVEARLLFRLENDSRARVGVLFDLAPGWHVYWRSAGDTGIPPELIWNAEGMQFGPTLWPAPHAFDAAGPPVGEEEEEGAQAAASYGYPDRVLLASELRGARAAREGARVAVDADVLVCEYECVPASFRLERALNEEIVGLSAAQEAALFEQFAASLPDSPREHGLELSGVWSQSAIRPGDHFEAAIAIRSCTRAATACEIHEPRGAEPGSAVFFPDDMETVELRVSGVHPDASDPQLYWVELRGQADADDPIEAERLTGVLALRSETGALRHVEVDLPFPTAARGAEVTILGQYWREGATGATEGSELGLLHAILLALLGGLVLNLMPCVLPVLAIKVFSISELAEAAHGGRAEPIRHGIAYTAGILGSMAVLASVVIAMRAGGRAVGWGFQFQEPIYIAVVSAVLVAFALNLFGSFEIRGSIGPLADLGRQATGARRSFFEGLLAVALATPCSAPFLGTAVGFAFASPPAVILAIFLAVGLGLAAPFAAVTLIPSWARFVPRSGAWMQVVRAGLGFALLATVAWLLWIFGGSAGISGMAMLIAFLLTLAFALWCFGLLQRSERPRVTLAAGAAVLLFSAGGLNAVNAEIDRSSGDDTATRSADVDAEEASAWQPWSPGAVTRHLESGTPVFVRFTADWCITCKVNEATTLKADVVRSALDGAGVAQLVGDWTKRDDAIRSELARHGRAGVPLYLVYDPQRPDEPEILPELLTKQRVLGAIRRLADGS